MASWLDEAEEETKSPSWMSEAEVEDDPYAGEDPEGVATRLAEQKYEAEKPGMAKSFALGTLQGVARGWGDEAMGRLNSILGNSDYESARDRVRMLMQRAENQNPASFGAGDLTGAIGSTAAVALPGAATLPGVAGYALAEGATRSLGDSSKLNERAVMNAGLQGTQDAGFAALLNRYGPKVLDLMKSASAPIAKTFNDRAGRAAVTAMKPTQGMMTDLDRKGIVEEVGNWALDNKVVRPFNSQADMDERAWKATADYARQTNPIYEKTAKATVSNEDLKQSVLEKALEIQRNPANVKMGRKVEAFADDLDRAASLNAVGKMGPEDVRYNPAMLRKIRQDLQGKVNFKSKPNTRGANDELRKIVREKEMGLIESIDPDLRAQNENLFRNIRMGNEAEKITERGAAQSDVNRRIGLLSTLGGGFTASSLTAAGLEPSMAIGIGAGVGLGSEIIKRYGSQWNATASRAIAKAANSETYRPLFEKALRNGPAAIASLHSQLLDEDPSYRALITE